MGGFLGCLAGGSFTDLDRSGRYLVRRPCATASSAAQPEHESPPVALTARLWQTPMSALAPLLPYVVLVVFLVLRPMGLMGRRAG